jgi:serine/threonine protein kinase
MLAAANRIDTASGDPLEITLVATPRPALGGGEGSCVETGAREHAIETVHDDVPIGQRLPGSRYRVRQKLGEGGMGAVYAAEHVDIERLVAIKVVHAEIAGDAWVRDLFRQEARAASRIRSPYVCDVTDWGELPDGRSFFVMEHLDGPSLATVLERQGPLPAERCIPILRQVAKALAAAHDTGLVHLDVKPDNIVLLERDGRPDAVKVVDFGLAGQLGAEAAAASSRVMGTPEYIAPERAAGAGYDHRSDIYSLGVTAYQLLTGRVPFKGATPHATLVMQTSETPAPMRDWPAREIPPALEAVVMRMLEKTPERRPQSMAEVEALLLDAQIGAGLSTPWDDLPLPTMASDSCARIGRKLRARRPSLVGALAAAFLPLLVFLGRWTSP